MSRETAVPEAQIMQSILGKWISKPIHVAATLAIPDILSDGAKSVDVVAKVTGTHEESLYRLMRALSCVGIFAETEDRTFINTTLSECLRADRLRSIALMFHSKWHDATWDSLLYSIRTGKPAFDEVHGKSAFEWFEAHPSEAAVFHEANNIKATYSHRVILDEYDFEGVASIVDVGGGLGGLAVEILRAYPSMTGVVADLPGVVRRLAGTLKTHGLEDRLSTVECDFFREIPGGGEVYLLSNVLHDWPDDKCIAILKNCRRALRPDSRLLIVEAIVTGGNGFSIAKLQDLEVLLMGGGRERTEAEFGILLESAGLTLTEVIPTSESISIIESVPA